jgi:hypothetical protein
MQRRLFRGGNQVARPDGRRWRRPRGRSRPGRGSEDGQNASPSRRCGAGVNRPVVRFSDLQIRAPCLRGAIISARGVNVRSQLPLVRADVVASNARLSDVSARPASRPPQVGTGPYYAAMSHVVLQIAVGLRKPAATARQGRSLSGAVIIIIWYTQPR